MKCPSISTFLLLAAGVPLALTAQAPADDQSTQDQLLQRLAELEARDADRERVVASLRNEVADLRGQTGEAWLSEQRADEIRGLVHEVLADADTRASLLQNGATGGWDKGFFLASPDGNFRLNLAGAIQFRFAYNHQDDAPSDNDRWGFENKRVQLMFTGHVVDPSWQYMVHGVFAASGGSFGLFDTWIQKNFDNGWSVRGGKFKLPFMHEQLMAYTKLLAVERSVISGAFGVGRSEGVQVAYAQDRFRFAAALSDGLGSIGGTSASALAEDTEYAVTGRIETVLVGDWGRFADFSGRPDEEFAAMIGGAVHWQNGEYGTMLIESELLRWTIDTSMKWGGANLYAAIVGNHVEPNSSALSSVDQYGLVVQGGLFVTDEIELFGRYEWGDDDSGFDDLSLVTIGAVKYFSGHQLKWTSDIGFALNEVSPTFADGGANWRADTTGNDGQIVFRSQFQLTF